MRDLAVLGFAGVVPEATGSPSYHPSTLLRIYLYGYVNQVQSSRRLEREAQRNIEPMWLVGRLVPAAFRPITDFQKDNGAAIRAVCRRFVMLCGRLGLIGGGTVAVNGSRFKAVNPRQLHARRNPSADGTVDASIARYLGMLDTAERGDFMGGEGRTSNRSDLELDYYLV
jgi:transposase